MADDKQLLEKPDEQESLQSGDDLAIAALAGQSASDSADPSLDAEEMESDKLAETLTHLQNVIERNANELSRINEELKERRESMKNVFENDQELAQAEAQVSEFTQSVKQRRSQLQSNPQVTTLKTKIGELNEQKKEIEETISNHLINYFGLTNSKSFDTTDGDQWEFDIKAKVKSRKK